MTENKKRFSVISNEKREKEIELDSYKKERIRYYQTNPLKMQGQSLKEQFMRFTNEEAGRRFTVEDLLRGC
jgi:hypothetical protein